MARSYIPGSEWLYVKLYASPSTCDELLASVVADFVSEQGIRAATDSWHFLRYGDPHHHLRLRLRLRRADVAGTVLGRLRTLLESWVRSGAVHRVQVDTYEREVERYGGPSAIELIESLFCADSEVALAITAMNVENSEKWILACAGADALCADFGLDSDEREKLFGGLADALGREAGIQPSARKAVAGKLRRHRAELEAALLDPPPWWRDLTGRRSVMARDAIRELYRLAAGNALQGDVHAVLGSLVHMHVNRMMTTVSRSDEAVMYALLNRLYMSFRSRGVTPTHAAAAQQ